jgi:hypothetical protein
MRLTSLICLLLLSSNISYSQLIGGELVKEGRKLAVASDFTMHESTEGAIYYRLAVDREGKVTSAQLLSDKSSQISTPLQVRARTYVLGLKFQPGTHYPKFHDCEVKINLIKKN